MSEASEKYFHLCPEKYLESIHFYRTMCSTMIDFLKEYNLKDCRILAQAIKKHWQGFKEDFDVDLHKKLSLPGISQEIAFKNYDSTMNKIYSIPIPKIKEDIRKFLNGGICLVLHRLIKLNSSDPNIPESARVAPNGKKYVKIMQEDFNSLYPHAFEDYLPTGPGFFLKKVGNSFRMISMDKSGKNVSTPSLQWLEYMAAEMKIQIQHQYKGGEHKIGNYFLDGYSVINGKTHGFDFNGCR